MREIVQKVIILPPAFLYPAKLKGEGTEYQGCSSVCKWHSWGMGKTDFYQDLFNMET